MHHHHWGGKCAPAMTWLNIFLITKSIHVYLNRFSFIISLPVQAFQAARRKSGSRAEHLKLHGKLWHGRCGSSNARRQIQMTDLLSSFPRLPPVHFLPPTFTTLPLPATTRLRLPPPHILPTISSPLTTKVSLPQSHDMMEPGWATLLPFLLWRTPLPHRTL